jgi:hypothetical protein
MSKRILAVKTLNQYRKRDITAYLGLRYYLHNVSAARCNWIKKISHNLAMTQEKPPYLKISHFKEIDNNIIKHRDIYIPSPNEALAEADLLTELSKLPKFQSESCVYSYRFADHTDTSGVFKAYFGGLQERHKNIAKACQEIQDAVVLYADIKRFYPSIKSEDAFRVWKEYTSESGLPVSYIQLGEKLLANHKKICDSDKSGLGILTGPQFSHLIANLLLKSIDQEMSKLTNGHYYRYVDDVILIGQKTDVEHWRKHLSSLFSQLGLKLHDGSKDFTVSKTEWLTGENDFESSLGKEWLNLSYDLQRFLVIHPDKKELLVQAVKEKQMRILILDYARSGKESTFLHRFRSFLERHNWYISIFNKTTVASLLTSAEKCRDTLRKALTDIMDILAQSKQSSYLSAYQRKRMITKLRYLTSILIYLLSDKELLLIAIQLQQYPELQASVSMIRAVVTRDVTEVISMGCNVTQSAAQLLRVSDLPVTINEFKLKDDNSDVIEQSLAVLSLNGISYTFSKSLSDLRCFSTATNMQDLMSSEHSFIQEIACLHGVSESRHSEMLNSAFDNDEPIVYDILYLLDESGHY